MTPELILSIASIVVVLCLILIVACYLYGRRDRLRRAYRHIGTSRRQSRYSSDMFIRAPESELLQCFLRSYLKVPDTVLGFDSQSQLTLGDLSRLATLWAALGNDANLCYGFIDEDKRFPRRSNAGSHASFWVEFSFLGEMWVYWYEDDVAIVDYRRSFYRRGAATILQDLRFSDAGRYLFKT